MVLEIDQCMAVIQALLLWCPKGELRQCDPRHTVFLHFCTFIRILNQCLLYMFIYIQSIIYYLTPTLDGPLSNLSTFYLLIGPFPTSYRYKYL